VEMHGHLTSGEVWQLFETQGRCFFILESICATWWSQAWRVWNSIFI